MIVSIDTIEYNQFVATSTSQVVEYYLKLMEEKKTKDRKGNDK